MIYVGDALFPGNDYLVEQVGVISIPVRDPIETMRVSEAIIACLGSDHQARSIRVEALAVNSHTRLSNTAILAPFLPSGFRMVR